MSLSDSPDETRAYSASQIEKNPHNCLVKGVKRAPTADPPHGIQTPRTEERSVHHLSHPKQVCVCLPACVCVRALLPTTAAATGWTVQTQDNTEQELQGTMRAKEGVLGRVDRGA